jgi:RHS repeat-associated protein
VRRSRTIVYTNDNASVVVTNSMSQTSTDGLTTWQTVYRDAVTAVTTCSATVYGGSGSRTVTVTNPDSSSSVSVYSYGRLQSVTRKDSGGNQVAQTSFGYDAHGRQSALTDARNGTTSYTFNNADQVATVTSPLLGSGEPAQVTTTFYDTMGRRVGVQNPDGTAVTNLYFVTGLLQKSYGARTYPVEYTYDAQGRMRTMKTWQKFAADSGAATTRWNYDLYRGWLASKDYPDASTGQPPVQEGTGGPTYTYTGAGRASTRVWKRGITTTYGYNNAGDLATISYSDSTPRTTYGYDRQGRRTQAVRNGITTAIIFNGAAQPLTESYTGGTLDGLAMSWAYDTSLRLSSVSAKNGATTLQSATYGYDTAGRLQTVTDSSYTATYTYQANSALINTLAFTNSGAAGMVTTRAYDKLNRLQSISSRAYTNGVALAPVGFAYQYNAANQRTRAMLTDGTYWIYQYDPLGQVISGTHFWADGTLVAGQDFSYAFDDIGNRISTGGRASAASTYTVNRLNQYSSRTVAPYVDVLGIANPTTNVTVNGNTANRKGEYFHWPLNVPNATAQYPNLTIVSQYGATQTQTGAVYVTASTESFQPDADGNLTSDGRWTYTWDGENRLIQMIRDTDTPAGARQKLVFEYDHQARRIRKQFFTYSGRWVEQTDTLFLYDGWNLAGELNANASNANVRSYVWGSDLSGSLQGAGGVGGLLKVTYVGTTTTNAFVAYDGNGNVAGLADAANGRNCARYEYGVFAEAIRMSGPMGSASPITFSTKYQDRETEALYYGYRYYTPKLGNWLSRDLAAESGGLSLYAFNGNRPLLRTDQLGLFSHSHACSNTRLAVIRAAEARAKAQAKAAYPVLLTQFEPNSVMSRHSSFRNRYLQQSDFASTYRAWEVTTGTTLVKLNNGFDADKYGVECECWCSGDKLAYVNSGYVAIGIDDDIHFCPAFFRKSATIQAETFMHEASHLLADTDDLMLNGGPPWPDNGRDAYWIETLAALDPFIHFDNWVRFYTSNYGRM